MVHGPTVMLHSVLQAPIGFCGGVAPSQFGKLFVSPPYAYIQARTDSASCGCKMSELMCPEETGL